MTFATELHHRRKVAEFSERHRLGLLTLLFTDMIGSTDMKQRLGDIAAVSLMRLHHALLREALAEFREAEEIGVAGDSFFIAFTRPSDAVKFALLLQSRLRTFNQTSSEPLRDRVGIHIGEVVIEEKDGALDDLYGIQVDTCSRVMSLADAEQILLTRSAFDNARQVLKGLETPGLKPLSWLNHGPYRLKGVEEPLEICEVGETPFAALVPPKDSEKAHRHISADSEPVLGWRPSIGQQVPNTRWVLDRQLGEGGFGEVWLAHHESLNEERVFKFCFRADRVRSLKRELTLFKILKERVGHHPNIVGIQDVFLETPPFYLVMDYEEAKDLRAWSLANGGANSISLEDRLEIVAQVCEAVSAAHNAGILHRDIKPSNILVSRHHEGGIKARLMDFGIGQVLAEEAISAIRREGFTETVLGKSSAQTGSQLYMAPELLAGQRATEQSDIYSIGVVLFQLIVGDFQRPLTTDWQDDIHDPVLRDDLKSCFAGNPSQRFSSALELQQNLRSLESRARSLREAAMEFEKKEKERLRQRLIRTRVIASFLIAVFSALSVYSFLSGQSEKAARDAAITEKNNALAAKRLSDEQRERAEASEQRSASLLYGALVADAERAIVSKDYFRLSELLKQIAVAPQKDFEWRFLEKQAHQETKRFPGVGKRRYRTTAAIAKGASRVFYSSESETFVVDMSAGTRLWAHHFPETRHAVFSEDGGWVAAATEAGGKIWDATTGKVAVELKNERTPDWVGFSRDGTQILTHTLGFQAMDVLGFPDGEKLRTISTPHQGETGSFVSADGSHFLISGGNRNETTIFGQNGDARRTFDWRDRGSARAIAFSESADLFLASYSDANVTLWNLDSPAPLLTLPGSRDLEAMALSQNNRLAATAFRNSIKIWDLTTGAEIAQLEGSTFPVLAVAFASAATNELVSVADDGEIRLWKIPIPDPSRDFFDTNNFAWAFPAQHGPAMLTISPGPRTVIEGYAAAIRDGNTNVDVAKIRNREFAVWDVRKHQKLFSRQVAIPEQPLDIRFDVSPNLSYAYVDLRLGGRALWNLKTGESQPTAEIVTFSFDGEIVLESNSSEPSADLRVVETASNRELFLLNEESTDSAAAGSSGPGKRLLYSVAAAFSHNGTRLILADRDEPIRIWDVAQKRVVAELEHGYRFVSGVSLDASGECALAVSGDGEVTIWNVNSRQIKGLLTGHTVTKGRFLPGSNRVITGSDDGEVTLWDVAGAQKLLKLASYDHPVYALEYYHNERAIFTGFTKTIPGATDEEIEAWQKEAHLKEVATSDEAGAETLLMLGKTAEAFELRKLLFAANKDDALPPLHFGVHLLWLQDLQRHEEWAQLILPHFVKSTDAAACERAAKLYLLNPNPKRDLLEMASALAERAISSNDTTFAHHFEMAQGLAKFRMGLGAEAENWLKKAEASDNKWIRFSAIAIRSMVLAKAGDPIGARRLLDQSETLIDRPPKRGTLSESIANHDLVACWLLREEALATILTIERMQFLQKK